MELVLTQHIVCSQRKRSGCRVKTERNCGCRVKAERVYDEKMDFICPCLLRSLTSATQLLLFSVFIDAPSLV